MPEPDDPVAAYNHGVEEFAARFESAQSDDLWAPVREFIPSGHGRIGLDVGAGTGKDAEWLRELGLQMVAVEPAEGLRRLGQELHPKLRWIDDRLPELGKVHRMALAFDLVMLSAVWMHIRPAERPRAFRKLSTLLKPGGVLLLTLRHGPSDSGRIMYEVSLGEIEALARDFGLIVVRALRQPDALGRHGVDWTTVCLRVPDDGSVGLPLIRGVILQDTMSSTYKLGLLRSVAKIADAAPSLGHSGLPGDDDRVSVPLGLVALNWLRNYLPLVSAGLPQTPNNRGPDGLGFAKEGFRALMALNVDPRELSIGRSFANETAAALSLALREARHTIVNMPVRYTTLPNSPSQVFVASGQVTTRLPAAFTVDGPFLELFGELSMPGPLWRTMLRLGAWIEPLLLAEWVRMTRGYAERMGVTLQPGVVEARLAWQEPQRDTTQARAIARGLMDAGSPIHCVWSGIELTPDTLDIDHTLPWATWPCNDLWNLAPASRTVNQREKRNRLPSAAALSRARDPILAWWGEAWEANPALAARFAAEARSALPIEGAVTPDAAFAGLEWRRLRVELDQQAPIWSGLSEVG